MTTQPEPVCPKCGCPYLTAVRSVTSKWVAHCDNYMHAFSIGEDNNDD
jgi:hypothetical protein